MPDSPGSTQSRNARPNPNERLVKVFDSEVETEAMVVKGLLEASGIDADITALDAPQDTFPGVGGTIVLVREEDANLARQVIEEYRKSALAEDETAEVDISEEPPEQG